MKAKYINPFTDFGFKLTGMTEIEILNIKNNL